MRLRKRVSCGHTRLRRGRTCFGGGRSSLCSSSARVGGLSACRLGGKLKLHGGQRGLRFGRVRGPGRHSSRSRRLSLSGRRLGGLEPLLQ